MCHTLSDNDTIHKTQYGKGKSHATPEGVWKSLYDKGVINTGIHK